MKETYCIKALLLFLLLFYGLNIRGEVVTYTIASKTSVTVSGDYLEGSSAVYSTTYNSTNQLTNGNSMTLALKGYAGYVIKKLQLFMRSNTSTGAGYLSMKAGSKTLVTIGSKSKPVTFNKFGDNSGYTANYKTVNIKLEDDSCIIEKGDDIEIIIGATTNSLYISSYTLTYEKAVDKNIDKAVSDISLSGSYNTNYYIGEEFDTDNLIVTATYEDGTTSDVTLFSTISEPNMTDAGKKKVVVSYSNNVSTVSSEYDIDVREVTNTVATAYSIDEAIDIINRNLFFPIYVEGFVSNIVSSSVDNAGQLDYCISVDGATASQQFVFYHNKPSANTTWTSIDEIKVGDRVIGYGTPKKDNNTYSFDTGNYLVQHQRLPQFLIEDISIPNGENILPVISTNNTDAYTVTYLSDNDEVVRVASSELVTTGVGTATITAIISETDNFLSSHTTFKIIVTPGGGVRNIAIIEKPNITTYHIGDTFDTDGLKVIATYGDGNLEDVTSNVKWSFEPHEFTVPGFQSIMIKATYDNVEDIEEYYVNVNERITTEIDLTINSCTSATPTKVVWNCDAATMTAEKAAAGTATNNWLGKDNQTRFYQRSTLTISPVAGARISSLLFTTSRAAFANNLSKSKFSNAKSRVEGNIVTLETIDQTKPVVITFSESYIECEKVVFNYEYDFKRSVTNNRYGTICLPSTVNKENVAGAEFYNISGVTKNGSDITGVALELVEGNLEAGRPYIFKATADAIVASYSSELIDSVISATGLVGNLNKEKITVEDGNYVVSNNRLRKVSGGTATIYRCRAYVNLDDIEEYIGNSKSMLFLDGATTDIDLLQFDVNNILPVYNLQGQRVNPSSKGLLIVGNKKLYVK